MLAEHLQLLHIRHDNLPILITSALGTIGLAFVIRFALKTTTIRQGEPPLFPGALPLLGHVIPYGKDANKIYQEARYVSLALGSKTCVHLSLSFLSAQGA